MDRAEQGRRVAGSLPGVRCEREKVEKAEGKAVMYKQCLGCKFAMFCVERGPEDMPRLPTRLVTRGIIHCRRCHTTWSLKYGTGAQAFRGGKAELRRRMPNCTLISAAVKELGLQLGRCPHCAPLEYMVIGWAGYPIVESWPDYADKEVNKIIYYDRVMYYGEKR